MIIIADLHLGRVSDSVYNEAGVPSRFTDTTTRLREVLSVASAGGHSIVVAGDVFDRINPTIQAMMVFFDWLQECEDAGVKVHVIAGNHDASVALTNVHMMKSIGYTTHIYPQVVEVDGVAVGMAPHLPRRDRETLLGEQSYSEYLAQVFKGSVEIIIGHGQVVDSGYANDIFFEAAEAMEFDRKALKGFRIFLGHIHNRSNYGTIHYPGSILVHNYGEVDDEKGYFIVDRKGSHTWAPFESKVQEYRVVEVDLTTPREVDEEAIKEAASGALLKVVYYVGKDSVVDTHSITQLFNRHGVVTRVATVAADLEEKKVQKKVVVSQNHAEMLKAWLKGREVERPTDVFKLGKAVIEEVLG